jgi:type IV pilus assembly protein PilE
MTIAFTDPSPSRRRARGFTLIEMMIVVAIAAILAAVVLPMYRTYVQRGRIIDATSRLSDFRVRMEQYYMDNRTYDNAGKCGVADPTDTNDAAFTIECSGSSATAYTAKATGKASKGMKDFVYEINQAGAKKTSGVPSSSGWTANATCWVTQKDGSC